MVKMTKEQFEEVRRLFNLSDFNSVMCDLNGYASKNYPILEGLEPIEVATAWIAPEKIRII
jgi:hypothetical protein